LADAVVGLTSVVLVMIIGLCAEHPPNPSNKVNANAVFLVSMWITPVGIKADLAMMNDRFLISGSNVILQTIGNIVNEST
jgi:hypothetical protein